jgi:L-threonylcarbamoyladenylate synthase
MLKNVKDKLLIPGTIGIIPTDTVYGIVARAEDKDSVNRLYKLKHRESKPGTIIAASIGQLEDLGIKHRYLKAVAEFWPGPISVIVPVSDPNLNYLHQDKFSLAVRIPDNQPLRELLNSTGPLVTSSANPPTRPTAVTVYEARNYFSDNVDFYVDGGDLSNNLPSTIIRVLDDAIEVVREGSVKIDQ